MSRTNCLLFFILWMSTTTIHAFNPLIIPFKRAGKIIYVEAQVEQKSGFFILDTGSNHLLLNQSQFQGKQSGEFIFGINAQPIALMSKIVKFQIGQISKRKVYSQIIDLAPIENRLGIPLVGIIGNHFFNDYEVVFNYERQEMILTQMDQSAISKNSLIAQFKIRFKGHLPVVKVKIGDQVLNLAIDSGAEINVFHHNLQPRLKAYLKDSLDAPLTGLDNTQPNVIVGTISQVSIGALNYNPMRTLFSDLSHLNKSLPGPDIDGLIGYEFLHQHTTGINFKNKVLTIWKDGNPAILSAQNWQSE